ncbi:MULTISPECIES: phosphatidate cytidylyltransferase [Thiomonas]|jgi:phosphatidate cytidylyltransferase|uniref:phosphatidate cytidylyltransferase n=1 Tax=Thiomonas TaxID=32012 RepID=UPI000AA65B22|nr:MULTISPECIES: phosphatidate cytidylyltransferase [Thiomonas]MBN8777399.1 phosphatidate cytidylyltransferase [Thiomonas arsenitoxydans]OZB71069.1 MAG: phosphatidate cytidylyltransferase [Thiomonas sp. 13-64-67]
MLRQRVLTALVLMALLLPTLFWRDPLPFALLALAFCAVGMGEWARLAGYQGFSALSFWALLWAAIAAALLWLLQQQAWQMASAWRWFWLACSMAWLLALGLSLPKARLPAALRHPLALTLLGFLLLQAAWLALVQLRVQGALFMLSLLALVWVADIAAYFGGRAWGRSKLAPSISPGKTRAGAWTALIATLFYAAVCASLAPIYPNYFSRLNTQFGGFGLAILVVVLLAFAIAGDLFESLLKRAAGLKDSGKLLPGHGGVLDRIDALLPVLPLALLLLAL